MGAPSGTTWGNVITGDKSTRQGKIGIYVSTSNTSSTVTKVTVEVWYWSMYSLEDAYNTYYANWDTKTATTSKGDANLYCTVSTGSGWSTSNQMKIATYSKDYTRSSSSQTKYFSAKITGIENHGYSNVSSHYVSFTIPALTTYTVSYNANGGSGAPSSQTKYYGQDLTLSSTRPTRTGYYFQGWATSSTGPASYYAGAQYTSNSSITLYAVWGAYTYTVSYNANGGSGAPSSQTKTYGVTLYLSNTIPTRNNYSFVGWGISASDTSPTYFEGSPYTSNSSITLYAIWSLDYVKPRVYNVWVMRCDVNGNAQEDGDYALISFDWSTDKTGAGYRVYYKESSANDYISGSLISLSGTSGSVQAIIQGTNGKVTFDKERSYDIRLNVTDSVGYVSTNSYLNALYIAIDVTADGLSMSFGEPADEDVGLLKIAFPTVDIKPTVALKYRGGKFFGGELFWQGSSVMTESSTITLPERVSEQRNGLMLVFSRNGDYNYTSYFVPKELIATVGNTSTTFPLCTSLFDYIGQKTLYITDTDITGHTDNDATGKNATSGITYHNEAFFLRYVYGV